MVEQHVPSFLRRAATQRCAEFAFALPDVFRCRQQVVDYAKGSRVRYAAANKGQSAATTTVATAASGFITSGSAPMATSSAMGCSPDSALI